MGVSSFNPLDGESAEKRWCDVDVDSVDAAGVDMDATELVDAFRSPVKDIESRLDLRGRMLLEVDADADAWRGTRDVEFMDGDPRIEGCLVGPETVLAAGTAPSSMTPNSLVDRLVGDGFVEDVESPWTIILVLRLAKADAEVFKGGEAAAEVRLEMRGILVGVSFGRLPPELNSADGGSLGSLIVWALFVLFVTVPTEGDPAMVGNWWRLRREVSDCFCIELAVCDVSLEEEEAVRVGTGAGGVAGGVEDVTVDDFSLATR